MLYGKYLFEDYPFDKNKQVIRRWVDKADDKYTHPLEYRPRYTLVQDLQIIIQVYENYHKQKADSQYEAMIQTLGGLVRSGKSKRTVDALYKRYQRRLRQIDQDDQNIIAAYIMRDGRYNAYLNFEQNQVVVLVEGNDLREFSTQEQQEENERQRLRKKWDQDGQKNYLRYEKPEPNYKLHRIQLEQGWGMTPEELKDSECRRWRQELELQKERETLLWNQEFEKIKEKKEAQLQRELDQYEESLQLNWRKQLQERLNNEKELWFREQEDRRKRQQLIWEHNESIRIQRIKEDFYKMLDLQMKQQQEVWQAKWQKLENLKRSEIRYEQSNSEALSRIQEAAKNGQMTKAQKDLFEKQLEGAKHYFLSIHSVYMKEMLRALKII